MGWHCATKSLYGTNQGELLNIPCAAIGLDATTEWRWIPIAGTWWGVAIGKMGPAYGRRRETQPHSFLLPCFFSFFFSFLSFSLVYPRPFPWSIKGKARLPIQGPNPTKPEQKSFYRTSPLESNTLTHPHSHTSETWGPAPVLSVCNPYYKHSVLVTRATTVNWT